MKINTLQNIISKMIINIIKIKSKIINFIMNKILNKIKITKINLLLINKYFNKFTKINKSPNY